MVTYKTISEKAGVSESTVSKALSSSAEVSFATAEKIRKIACELGYYSDKRALRREYMRDFKPNIAIVCPEIISVVYSNIVESLVDRITAMGGRASIMVSGFSKENIGSIVESVARDPEYDGILSTHSFSLDSKINIPLVLLTQSICVGDYDRVFCNLTGDVEKLIEYLVSRGHRILGFGGEPLTLSKERSFREFLKKNKIPVCEEYIVRSNKRFYEAGRDTFREYMRRGGVLPDAVIFAYDEIAFGFMDEARRHGVRIPEDVSVVGINDTPFSEVSNPTLTSVSNWHVECANNAFDLLVSRILGSTAPIETISYESTIIERESVLNKI